MFTAASVALSSVQGCLVQIFSFLAFTLKDVRAL